MSVLEDLQVQMAETYPREFRLALLKPKDDKLSEELREDSGRMEKLAAAAGVLPAPDRSDPTAAFVQDVAVRGDGVVGRDVIFVVNTNGLTTKGYLPFEDYSEPTVQPVQAASSPVAQGGTAAVGLEDRSGATPPPPGVPSDIDDLDAKARAALISSPPEGVDPAAVYTYEVAHKNQATVLNAAKAAGLVPDGQDPKGEGTGDGGGGEGAGDHEPQNG